VLEYDALLTLKGNRGLRIDVRLSWLHNFVAHARARLCDGTYRRCLWLVESFAYALTRSRCRHGARKAATELQRRADLLIACLYQVCRDPRLHVSFVIRFAIMPGSAFIVCKASAGRELRLCGVC
jgi:hypothetical protein